MNITTAEELDALPVGSVFIDGLDNIGFRQEQGFLVPTGTWRDSMDKRSPTKWQTAEQVIRDSRAWGYDALPLTVLYRPDQPTEPARCAPSREDLSDILRTHNIECTGLGEVSCQGCRDRGWMSWHVYRQHVADAILALLADQPTVEQVKAEAVVEFIGRIRPGVNDGSPLAEILDHIAATELSPTQPTPDLFAAMGLPSVEVPSIGGEQHG